MEMESLQDLLIEQLQDLYNAEGQLAKTLPKMAKAATNEELKQAFLDHLEETKNHAVRLEQVFNLMDVPVKGKKCHAMEGLVEEGKEMMAEDAEPEVMDAGLIAASQRIEHYEMAGYGCVRTYANLLGNAKVVKLLQATLDEERAADEKLTELAESIINVAAMQH